MVKKKVVLEERDGLVGKECTKCSKWKSLSEFPKRKDGLGGVRSDCCVCSKKRRSKYYEQNKEKILSQNAEYREAHREEIINWHKEYYRQNKEEMNLQNKERYQNNREEILQKQKKYYAENREEIRERERVRYRDRYRERMIMYQRNYRTKYREKWLDSKKREYRKNKLKYKLQSYKRKSFVKTLEHTLTDTQLKESMAAFNNACALTGASNIQLDHVIPIASGMVGTVYGNIIPLRADLNGSKNDRNIFEWFEANRQRFNLSQERFDRLIEWLGKANGMTVEEYRDYVYWCHANPRDITQGDDNQAI